MLSSDGMKEVGSMILKRMKEKKTSTQDDPWDEEPCE